MHYILTVIFQLWRTEERAGRKWNEKLTWSWLLAYTVHNSLVCHLNSSRFFQVQLLPCFEADEFNYFLAKAKSFLVLSVSVAHWLVKSAIYVSPWLSIFLFSINQRCDKFFYSYFFYQAFDIRTEKHFEKLNAIASPQYCCDVITYCNAPLWLRTDLDVNRISIFFHLVVQANQSECWTKGKHFKPLINFLEQELLRVGSNFLK